MVPRPARSPARDGGMSQRSRQGRPCGGPIAAAAEKIYIVRHGETVWNRDRRIQGRGNSPLTQKGIEQTEAVAVLLKRDLAPQPEVELQCSTLERALQTARIIQQELNFLSMSFRASSLLVELDFGIWGGLTREEAIARFPAVQRERSRDRWHYRLPEGESYEMIFKRASRWFSLPRSARTTIVVTHARMSRVLRGVYLGLPPDEILTLKHPQSQIYKLHDFQVHSLSSGFE